MLENKENYWIFLEPTTFCSINGKGWFLYNTDNGSHYSSTAKEVTDLLCEIYNKKNLGVVLLSGDSVNQSHELSLFITEIEKAKLGGAIKVKDIDEKPVRLMPVLNLQRDIDRLKSSKIDTIGKDVSKYLLEVNLYINSSCRQTCIQCTDYYRQYLCCTSELNETGTNITIALLRKILQQISVGNLSLLNILGGNLLLHPEIEQIVQLLQPVKQIARVWLNYKNINKLSIFDGFGKNITVDFPVDEKLIHATIQKLDLMNTRYLFYITSQEEYAKALEIVENYPDLDYSVFPTYNGSNLDFFKQLVFVDRDDILEEPIPLRKVFAHQKLNTNFFGSLTILPNGNVKANMNSQTLGNVGSQSLLELIHKELLENTAWRQIRNGEPCSQCHFQFLCPSPSNLETAIGIPNLCNV